jgi:nucleotide-binding universal stress UspA family protein
MYWIDNILCATDFSRASIEALRVAQSFASKLDSTITLMYVDEYDQSSAGHFVKDEQQRAESQLDAQRFAEQEFKGIIEKLKLEPRRTKTIVRFGAAYKEIVSEAEAGRYSMILVGVHGIGCSSAHLIGRTAERIVRLCRAPVLTVRHLETIVPAIQTILCPTDFSEYGNFALPYAISLAKRFQAKLVILHVADVTVPDLDVVRSRFPDLAMYHEQAGDLEIERLVGRDIEPENTIVRIAEEKQVGLVVMGTHGARGLRRVQIGNTTEDVIRRVSMPVLSITHPIHKMIFPQRFREPSECKAEEAWQNREPRIEQHAV